MYNSVMEKTYTVTDVARFLGVNVKTVQRWDREGRLKPAGRTVTDRRYYTEEQIMQFRQETSKHGPRQIVAYCRVSSQAQRSELKNQRRAVEEFCLARGLANVDFVEEIASGMNFTRKKFLALTDAIDSGTVGTLILAHKDRLTRFGYEWFERFCQRHGCDILVLNQEHLSPDAELVQDLMSVTQGFSDRLSGLGQYRKKLQEALGTDAGVPNPAKSNAGDDPHGG